MKPSLLARAAHRYAEAGVPVFPLLPREKVPPKGSHACYDATTDLARVTEYWSVSPDANIGTTPGAWGAVAFDVDGEPSHAIAARIGIRPGDSLTVATPKAPNRWHVYFAMKDPPRGSPKIEGALICRSRGGYTILPPSIHPNGQPYRALTKLRDLAPLPDAVREALARTVAREEREKQQSAPTLLRVPREGASVIEQFNAAHLATAIIIEHGYKPSGERYLAPGSTTGLAGVVVLDDGCVFSHHCHDPLADGHRHDAFSVYCRLVHNGDVRRAVKAAAEALGIPARGRALPALLRNRSA